MFSELLSDLLGEHCVGVRDAVCKVSSIVREIECIVEAKAVVFLGAPSLSQEVPRYFRSPVLNVSAAASPMPASEVVLARCWA